MKNKYGKVIYSTRGRTIEQNNKKIPKNEFRYNYDTKHPNYIFLETGNKYRSFGITHKDKTFNKSNMPLIQNPNPSDKKNSYLRHGVVSSKKSNYGKKLDNFSFNDVDFKNVKSKVRHYKKRY